MSDLYGVLGHLQVSTYPETYKCRVESSTPEWHSKKMLWQHYTEHCHTSTHYIVPDVRSESHVTKNQYHSSNYCYTAECNVHAVIHRFSTEFFFCAVFKLPQGFSSQWGTRFSAFPDLNNLHNKFPTELGWFIITKLMMYKIQTKTGCSNFKKKITKTFCSWKLHLA